MYNLYIVFVFSEGKGKPSKNVLKQELLYIYLYIFHYETSRIKDPFPIYYLQDFVPTFFSPFSKVCT